MSGLLDLCTPVVVGALAGIAIVIAVVLLMVWIDL